MKLGIKAGDKYVWEPNFMDPIFVRVSQVRRHGSMVAAECWQGNKHWKRSFNIPLPASMRAEKWTFDQIAEAASGAKA